MFVDPRIARSDVGNPALANSRRTIITVMHGKKYKQHDAERFMPSVL